MNNDVRLVVVTGHEFGYQALSGMLQSAACASGSVSVSLVVGLDHGAASHTVGYRDPSPLARSFGVSTLNTSDGRLMSAQHEISGADPDYLLVIGWSSLVPDSVLRLARGTDGAPEPKVGWRGAIGMHPTKLPLGRGQAPIPWTIIKGLSDTALTVFFLSSQPDAGDIIAQYPIGVSKTETSHTLFRRFAALHYQAGAELADAIASHGLAAAPQDNTMSSRWPKRRPRDGELTHTMSLAEVDAMTRALATPYPPAFFLQGNEPCYVSRVVPSPSADTVEFECSDGTAFLVPVQRSEGR